MLGLLLRRTIGGFFRFRRDTRGSIAVNFALALVPITLAVGGAVDYSYSNRAKAELDAAADAAVLAAVSKTGIGTKAATAKQFAQDMFNAQVASLARVTVKNVKVTVTDNGVGRTAVLAYKATTPTAFMAIAGINKMTIQGSSTAATAKPTYIDFYLLLDNTPSMGVGATPADVTTMVNNTPDQCAFACHDLSTVPNDYYSLAKKLGVTMRIDVVRQATQKLMDTANATQTTSGQFRMAIYTFGTNCTTLGLYPVQSLTSNLTTAKNAAQAIDLMMVPYQGYNNDQCTDSNGALTAVNNAISTPGDGSLAATPQKILFLVSDGVADAYYPSSCAKTTTNGRCQQPYDLSYCTTLKSRGIKIAALYTTYLPLPTNDWYNTWISPWQSTIGTNMQNCASPGLYFEVSPTQGISDAMTALFQKAVGQARLTK